MAMIMATITKTMTMITWYKTRTYQWFKSIQVFYFIPT